MLDIMDKPHIMDKSHITDISRLLILEYFGPFFLTFT